jgi:hypothetical protein
VSCTSFYPQALRSAVFDLRTRVSSLEGSLRTLASLEKDPSSKARARALRERVQKAEADIASRATMVRIQVDDSRALFCSEAGQHGPAVLAKIEAALRPAKTGAVAEIVERAREILRFAAALEAAGSYAAVTFAPKIDPRG